MYCGNFNGWSSGSCSIPDAGMYWGVEPLTIIQQINANGDSLSGIPCIPFTENLLAYNYNNASFYNVEVPEQNQYNFKALKTPGLCVPYYQNNVNFYKNPKKFDFDGISFNLMEDNYRLGINQGVAGPSFNYEYPGSAAFLWSISQFIGGEQKYITYKVYYIERAYHNDAQDYVDNDFDIKVRIVRYNISTNEIDFQSTASDSNALDIGFGYKFVSGSWQPETNTVGEADLPRHNIYIGYNAAVSTTYDLERDTWGVSRGPIGEGSSVVGTSCRTIHAGSSPAKFEVCRPAFHSNSSDEASDGPWVIAFQKNTQTWVEAVWTNEEPLNDDEDDPNGAPWLSDDDVSNGITIDSGTMSEDARCLCYNRLNNRTLAIFWDETSVLDSSFELCDPIDGKTYAYHTTRGIYIYDSLRPTDKLYLYDPLKNGCLYFPADPADPDHCAALDEEYAEPSSWTNDYLTYNPHKRSSGTGEKLYPTFITADIDGYVYIGSPNFIRKMGKLAGLKTDPYVWQYICEDYYPLETVTISPGPCNGYTGGEAQRVLPFSYIGSSDGYNFGQIDYREFTILPTKSGIQVRGLQGMREMATVDIDGINKNIKENYIKDYYEKSSGKMQLYQWITNWTFTFNGDAIPHIELAPMYPDFIISGAKNQNKKIDSRYSDYLEEAPFWHYIPEMEIEDPVWYYPLSNFEKLDWYNSVFLVVPSRPYSRSIFEKSSYGYSTPPRSEISAETIVEDRIVGIVRNYYCPDGLSISKHGDGEPGLRYDQSIHSFSFRGNYKKPSALTDSGYEGKFNALIAQLNSWEGLVNRFVSFGGAFESLGKLTFSNYRISELDTGNYYEALSDNLRCAFWEAVYD